MRSHDELDRFYEFFSALLERHLLDDLRKRRRFVNEVRATFRFRRTEALAHAVYDEVPMLRAADGLFNSSSAFTLLLETTLVPFLCSHTNYHISHVPVAPLRHCSPEKIRQWRTSQIGHSPRITGAVDVR